MTAQIHDQIRFNDQKFSLVHFHGNGLVDQQQIGQETPYVASFNWRGHSCRYAIRDQILFLDQLFLDSLKDSECQALKSGNGRRIMGCLPQPNKRHGAKTNETAVYKGPFICDYADLRINFTGTLILGADSVKKQYVHMGFRKAIDFATVLELHFTNGSLKEIIDRSVACRIKRELAQRHHRLIANNDQPKNIGAWVKDRFARDKRPDFSYSLEPPPKVEPKELVQCLERLTRILNQKPNFNPPVGDTSDLPEPLRPLYDFCDGFRTPFLSLRPLKAVKEYLTGWLGLGNMADQHLWWRLDPDLGLPLAAQPRGTGGEPLGVCLTLIEVAHLGFEQFVVSNKKPTDLVITAIPDETPDGFIRETLLNHRERGIGQHGKKLKHLPAVISFATMDDAVRCCVTLATQGIQSHVQQNPQGKK